MANEQLTQQRYLESGQLRGGSFGEFEELQLGATRVSELLVVGVDTLVPSEIEFPFREFKPPQSPPAAKPDRVYLRREDGDLRPVAVAEFKQATKFNTPKQVLSACEQALYNGAALGVSVAVATDGARFRYIDVEDSTAHAELRFFNEKRDFNPGVLSDLLSGAAGVVKDPRPLAEHVWQLIWHATKASPEDSLLTFVEIFVLKFLSDNLGKRELPDSLRFYELTQDPKDFKDRHGMTAIEYYISHIRPRIKTLFPDNTVAADAAVPALFGLNTVVSKTSVINGFAFLTSSEEHVASYNRVFLNVLKAFQNFGPLSSIDPEFKLRLYETFLKRSARQQRLGQYFTPRNIVRPMIRMARLDRLSGGATVLDPAAGVGGFILEPLLFADSLPDNYSFQSGSYSRRVITVGVDIDPDLHILSKANMLLHLAEQVRDPATTTPALNKAMADTFVLMNRNQTLGALENPPVRAVDVILTNPPYVTDGSAVYRDELRAAKGTADGMSLAEYYEGSGLGVEGLFMRLIVGALKPGGRAFVVVPMGFLNRTTTGPKQRILDHCNVLCSIALPRGAFFNTPQPAYILGLERRHSDVDPRPEVFCGMARSVGETLDWQRVPTPHDNDLAVIAEAFVAAQDGERAAADASPVIRFVDPDEFSASDRWDVGRFWSDDELVDLGQKPAAVTRIDFIDDAHSQLRALLDDFNEARSELEKLQEESTTATLPLSDRERFLVRSGDRIRNEDIRDHPGQVPVYSCFTNPHQIKGKVSAQWLDEHHIEVEKNTIATVMANGAKAVGRVFLREPGAVITDDVIAVESLRDDIDIDYLTVALRSAIAAGGYVYEAKLFAKRVRDVEVEVPVDPNGNPDVERQRQIAAAVKRFESIRERLAELGSWSIDARIR